VINKFITSHVPSVEQAYNTQKLRHDIKASKKQNGNNIKLNFLVYK